MTPHIAICIPSRGLGHSRTWLGLIREVESSGLPHVWCASVGLPIPDCANDITSQALADPDVTHLWYCEDDLLLPTGVLPAMLARDAPVVAVDYRMRNGERIHTVNPKTGVVLNACLGCTLVRREVAEALEWPPFRAETSWTVKGDDLVPTGIPAHWGQHDLAWSAAIRAAGYAIELLDGWECGHLAVQQQADRRHRTNHGADVERCWGGNPGIPWYPQKEGVMADDEVIYLRSPNGKLVIDMEKKKAAKYLKPQEEGGLGWTQINKSAFNAGLKEQTARAEARREEDRKEMAAE